MTLETLNGILGKLNEQYQMICSAPTEKPVVQHMNAVELLGAIQLCKQLIQQEQITLAAPPGATGPSGMN